MANQYSYFAFNLWRLRESRGKTTKDMAEYLKEHLSPREYRSYEMGEKIPNDQILLEISRILKIDITKLKQWALYGSRKQQRKDGTSTEGAIGYDPIFEQALVALEQNYKELSGKNINQTQKDVLKTIKRRIMRMIDLPVLPMNFILITNVVTNPDILKKYKYLHDIQDFIVEGESLAGFVARDLYLGNVIKSFANQLFYYDKPYTSTEACMNQLTITEFTELLLLAVYQNGIFQVEDDIPRLQQHADFSSMCCLFVRELQKELETNLPKNINFDHLYQACLLQGMGTFILYERLKPSLIGTGEEIFEDTPLDENQEVYPGMEKKLFSQIVYDLHPTVSAVYGANLSLPKEVLDIVLTHHSHPVHDVSPTCALLKLVNFFVDTDFPKLSKQEFQELLAAYPQVTLPVEPFYEVCCKLSKLKEKLFERSSTLIEESSNQVTDFVTNRVRQMEVHNKTSNITKDEHMNRPLKRSDFRFDQGYQTVLKNTAHTCYENLLLSFLSPRKNEPIKNSEERYGNFHLRLKYLLSKDLRDVSETYKAPIEEIKIRLGLKGKT